MATKLEVKESRLLGWHEGKYNFTLNDIAKEISLTKSEYLKIRETLHFQESDLRVLDKHFKIK